MKHPIRSLLAIAALAFLATAPDLRAQNSSEPQLRGDRGFVIAGLQGVASVSVGTAGTGYTSLPVVAFTAGGGGTQATGTATLKVVGTVTVTAAGTGYTDGDVLTLVGGTKTTAATFTVTETGGVIDSLAIAGAGVYTVPVLTTGAAVTGGTGTGATVTVGYGVGTVVVTSAGNTYTSAPTVGFSGGGGTSAAATATLAAVATTTADFCRILPLADCVVTEFTPFTRVNGKSYSAQSIVNRTLKASVPYDIFGKTIKFSSGHAILFLR